ncbi:MAG: C_GCAxxG_C_C family protein [Rhodobacteraceae bacterium]|nr:C_GCAxxG_C_C family protein [Paracoccaceae bacterium]
MTLVNREASVEEPMLEQAMHLFSGGFMHQGHACGHLWGATLSAGIRAAETFSGADARSAAALDATCRLVGALSEDDWAFTCRQNTGFDFASLSGRLKYLRSDKPRACGRKALAWPSSANTVIDSAIANFDPRSVATPCANCAVNCMSKVASVTGIGKDESAQVAGFAGGLGLSGNVCGALSVGVFALSVRYYQDRNPEKRDSKFHAAMQELNLLNGGLRKLPSRLLQDFKSQFGSELCKDIVGRKFDDTADHMQFVADGGCKDVVQFVADWLLERSGVFQNE